MFSVTRRALACTFGFMLILLLVAMPGLTPINITGSIASADASTPRSYVQFIDGAYVGALGRFPSCFEEQIEYDELVNAAAVGSVNAEAKRFVSTLFETQASFDDSGDYYCQSSEYETRNPAFCEPFINTRSDEFITDLYHAFLLRDPEPDGFNGWMGIIPTAGRKGVLNGFQFSVEFGILVDNLYPGTRPVCSIECPECISDPCDGPNPLNGPPSRLCR
jgi:hypothetical protein